jgi:beta-lactamase regulating signal transducer with metallopeptidase domain
MKEILITSSVLILVILLLRLILGKKVSKRLIYTTWLLVALRLLIPFQFGQLSFSITAVSEQLEQQSPVIQQVQEDFQQPFVGPDQDVIYDQLMHDYLYQNDAVTLPPAVETQLRQEAAAATAITPVELFTLIWISGIVLSAGWFIITNLLFLHKTQRDSVAFDQYSSPIPVRISPNVSTPCLAGLFRPRIYLTPESTQDPQQLNHVLTHELMHLKHRDHIWAWIRCLCLCIYWFNPLVWLAAIVSKRDCELACDEAALKQLGENQRIAYGKTLLATVTHAPVRVFQTTTAMNESVKHLKERVNYIVQKNRTFLIAAVCLILVVSLTTALVFTGCAPQEVTSQDPPVTDEPTTEPTTNSNTEPTTPPVSADVGSHKVLNVTPPPLTEEPAEALLIAQDAISRYLLYKVTGICCDYGYINADLSKYLSEEQKDAYYTQQYQITCCQNAQEVKNHIDRCIGSDLRNGYPDNRLFTDSDENLYLTINPMGYDGYRHFEVISQTEEQIIARACSYDEDGCFRATIFTLSKTQEGYQVTQVKEDEAYRCEPVVVDEGTNYRVLRYGSYYDYEIYGDDGYLKVSKSTQFYCPTITRISEDVWEIAVNYGSGKIQRTYWDMSRMRSEVYDNVVAVGFGKIAYLKGDLENQVLVVCDIFDRSNATTHKEQGFAPEAMPVTQAIFTEDPNGYGYILTISYRMGKQTNTTDTLHVSP